MTLAERFRNATTQALSTDGIDVALLPMVFARACVDVVPADGAGLSLTSDLRVPLGASDDLVSRAERLQTTLGEGPCLTATTLAEPLLVPRKALGRWPVFQRELLAQTPFRSVASVPLRSRNHSRLGALDLYFIGTEALTPGAASEIVTDIARPIASILFDDPVGPGTYGPDSVGATAPTWFTSEGATERNNVWVAIGMMMEFSKLANADALSVLRAFAYANDATLDEVARRLLARQLTPEVVFN